MKRNRFLPYFEPVISSKKTIFVHLPDIAISHLKNIYFPLVMSTSNVYFK